MKNDIQQVEVDNMLEVINACDVKVGKIKYWITTEDNKYNILTFCMFFYDFLFLYL